MGANKENINMFNKVIINENPNNLEAAHGKLIHPLLTGDVKDVVDVMIERHPTSHIVLVHGCNCHCNMGAGLALRIKKLYPEAYKADQETVSHDRTKLGTMSGATINPNLSVVNLYTQYNYGGGGVNVDYDAMRKCFESLVNNAVADYIFLIPKYIGCGLAGGDIIIVTKLIEEVFENQAYYLFDN